MDFCVHIGQFEGNGLVVGNLGAERFAFFGVFQRKLVGPCRYAQGLGGLEGTLEYTLINDEMITDTYENINEYEATGDEIVSKDTILDDYKIKVISGRINRCKITSYTVTLPCKS